ncbi:site-specific DNA-methyltransferase [Lachnoclostridium sp. Marseille-P6806]|uniref:site-specific DNA-methyltransferase n=1 Tax=Lachnoclostridium sp. Marseille-P6806 TaxID=2364793 RepID=UPI001030AD8A|nr:site-specific DNA-methyltransferase [Lachnoclostridium sp. Marseille-P6806]
MPSLNWIGKDKVLNHHNEVPYRVLNKKYSYGDDDAGNMVIHGDNLEALKSLLPKYEGKIRCIYIDPPYNTGNEGWIYNDNVNDPKIKKWLGEVVGKEGDDLSRHDKWLCMIYPRLRLLQKLMHRDEGVIFISIDENEIETLKMVCNEIFGKSKHIATIAWQKRYSRENRGAFGDAHEYILVYASNVEKFKEIHHKVGFDEKQEKIYKNPNNDPKGRWRGVPMTAQGYRPNQMYGIETPSGKVVYPPKGRCWSTVESEYKKLLAAGRIYFGKNGDGQPQTIRYLSEVEGAVPWSWWPSDEVGHTDEAKKEIMSIFPDRESIFDTPKPLRLIERILQIATDKDSIILDSFAGSGTTAHAVLNINRKDGGERKFIIIEMDEYADEITAERVKRVIQGYGEGNNKKDGIGGGFSFYELGEQLLIDNENINPDVDNEVIREYIWYMETKKSYERSNANDNPYYLGIHNDTAYYFNYEKDRQTVLDNEFLKSIKTKADAYVIYSDTCNLSDTKMNRFNITFKKIPRDIARL